MSSDPNTAQPVGAMDAACRLAAGVQSLYRCGAVMTHLYAAVGSMEERGNGNRVALNVYAMLH